MSLKFFFSLSLKMLTTKCINVFNRLDLNIFFSKQFVGSFTYEKYFAGKYIGELARLVFQKLHDESLFLVKENGEKITFPGSYNRS